MPVPLALYVGEPHVTNGFPSQMASNEENSPTS